MREVFKRVPGVGGWGGGVLGSPGWRFVLRLGKAGQGREASSDSREEREVALQIEMTAALVEEVTVCPHGETVLSRRQGIWGLAFWRPEAGNTVAWGARCCPLSSGATVCNFTL